MDLPSEVRRVKKPNGKCYYYWHPGRGTKREGKAIALGSDPSSPEFWERIRGLRIASTTAPAGSIAWVVGLYRESEAFRSCAESTQASYAVHLNRFANPEGWGHLPAEALEPRHVLALRDSMKETPVMANQMLAVGGTLWSWAAPFGHLGRRPFNPFEVVPGLDIPDRGHVPWPVWAQEYVLAKGPADLVRLVRLGVMTCQRESDLVRMGPVHRDGAAIWCRPVKTRKKRRAFRIPLTTTDALLLEQWAGEPILFENTRWKAPIARTHPDLYLFTPRAQAYTPDRIRARWTRWLETEAGTELCGKWRKWLAAQVERYDWDIEPEEARGPTIHGLRGTGVLVRLSAGHDPQQVSNDIGMSLPMVQRYIRFRDQVEVAEAGRRRLKLVASDG